MFSHTCSFSHTLSIYTYILFHVLCILSFPVSTQSITEHFYLIQDNGDRCLLFMVTYKKIECLHSFFPLFIKRRWWFLVIDQYRLLIHIVLRAFSGCWLKPQGMKYLKLLQEGETKEMNKNKFFLCTKIHSVPKLILLF